MIWNEGLDTAQEKAAGHIGVHARLLAGPGTGKSHVLLRRMIKLICVDGIDPKQIFALVFTRVNALKLRESVDETLKELGIIDRPRISTLHSYALEQLLRNHSAVPSIPQPIRIADDFEETQIIFEDLKTMVGIKKPEVEDRFKDLASDWQSLAAAETHYQVPDPKFLGAWEQHRQLYGYVLRLELIWRLKRALDDYPHLTIDYPSHLFVDEYQDLNKCDMDVISRMVERGAELFCLGDDDQSIYGFRKAHPAGIRNFSTDYDPSESFPLETCWRCDKAIIRLSQFVANMDTQRLEKPLLPREDAAEGEVALLQFQNQTDEAKGVAGICQHMIAHDGYKPDDILLLLRSDRYSAYSKVLVEAFNKLGIPVSVKVDKQTPLDTVGGRYLLCLMRLCADIADSFSWRTLLDIIRKGNRIGETVITEIASYAESQGMRFGQTILALEDKPELLKCGNIVRDEVKAIRELLSKMPTDEQLIMLDSEAARRQYVIERLTDLATRLISDEPEKLGVMQFLSSKAIQHNAETLKELLRALTRPEDTEIEQEVEKGKVNILSMHRAKGLDSKAVFLIATEDEILPGRSEGDDISDQRRLLYVSLTRAKHRLFITHSFRRTGAQSRSGRGGEIRTLTRFLNPLPAHILKRVNGQAYLSALSS